MSRYGQTELTSLDIDWFGVDKSGKLAQFASSTTGLVPNAVIERKTENEKLIEYFLETLSRSTCTVTGQWKRWVSVPNLQAETRYLDSFKEWGELGFYSYDCVYRGSVQSGGPYFLVARPNSPLLIDSLPRWARSLIDSVTLDLEFEQAIEIPSKYLIL